MIVAPRRGLESRGSWCYEDETRGNPTRLAWSLGSCITHYIYKAEAAHGPGVPGSVPAPYGN